MNKNILGIWFLDVSHGDSCYIELPNSAKMMIDCGGYNSWPSKMLKYYGITKANPVPIPGLDQKYGLDNLVISHPHGDHIADIKSIHDDVGFYSLTGNYSSFIDKISDDEIDFKKKGKDAANKFKEVVKYYTGEYDQNKDRLVAAPTVFSVYKGRFIEYEDKIDLNEISYLTAISFYDHKVLFLGDLTKDAVTKILNSNRKQEFTNFVKGATIIKIPHHGRENGCSEELFSCIGNKPLIGIVSDAVLNDQNEGASSVGWYDDYIKDNKLNINGQQVMRKVLTTRKDNDIYIEIHPDGNIKISTNCFAKDKEKILEVE